MKPLGFKLQRQDVDEYQAFALVDESTKRLEKFELKQKHFNVWFENYTYR